MGDELTARHHIVYYTFWPMLLLTFGTIFTSPAWWYFDVLPFKHALVIPWAAVLGACVYLMILGDYVIPSETYRKVRAGEWELHE